MLLFGSIEECYILDLVLLIAVLSYLIAATQILCDEYFIPSLRFIGNALRLSPDMEGATLMAMGSSTPELLTSLIAVYLYADDVDLNPAPSTIVGSGMFNMTFVIGSFVVVSERYHPLDALESAQSAHYLNSFALHRDIGAYIFSVIALYIFYDISSPKQMSGVEGLCLIMLWVLYVVVLLNSDRCSHSTDSVIADGDDVVIIDITPSPRSRQNHKERDIGARRWMEILSAFHRTFYSNPMRKVFGYIIPIKVPAVSDEADHDHDVDAESDFTVFPMPKMEQTSLNSMSSVASSVADSDITRCFMVFCLSVLWMSFITYLLLSAVSAMGHCLNVSASTMGITVIAIGSSLPDTLSSFILAKRYGFSMMGMVLSNCCSSNTFNICFVMGTTFSLKYAMRTVSVQESELSTIQNVDTEHAAGFMVMQILTSLLLLVMMHCNNMRLRTIHGVILMSVYGLFIVIFVLR